MQQHPSSYPHQHNQMQPYDQSQPGLQMPMGMPAGYPVMMHPNYPGVPPAWAPPQGEQAYPSAPSPYYPVGAYWQPPVLYAHPDGHGYVPYPVLPVGYAPQGAGGYLPPRVIETQAAAASGRVTSPPGDVSQQPTAAPEGKAGPDVEATVWGTPLKPARAPAPLAPKPMAQPRPASPPVRGPPTRLRAKAKAQARPQQPSPSEPSPGGAGRTIALGSSLPGASFGSASVSGTTPDEPAQGANGRPAHLMHVNPPPSTLDLRPHLARFFVIKSFQENDVYKAVKYSVWTSTKMGNQKLDGAFKESAMDGPIILFFSVNGSGRFCGMARMISPLNYEDSLNIWAMDRWQGQFSIRWVFIKDVFNRTLRHITIPWNENKPVTNSRDTQEIPYEKGVEMLSIFAHAPERPSLLDDYLAYERGDDHVPARPRPSAAADDGLSALCPPGRGGTRTRDDGGWTGGPSRGRGRGRGGWRGRRRGRGYHYPR